MVWKRGGLEKMYTFKVVLTVIVVLIMLIFGGVGIEALVKKRGKSTFFGAAFMELIFLVCIVGMWC